MFQRRDVRICEEKEFEMLRLMPLSQKTSVASMLENVRDREADDAWVRSIPAKVVLTHGNEHLQASEQHRISKQPPHTRFYWNFSLN